MKHSSTTHGPTGELSVVQEVNIIVDFNGIAIFDSVLLGCIRPEIGRVSNHGFLLKIVSQAVVTDLASFLEWNPEEDWQKTNVSPGDYSVRINGF